MYRQLCEIRVTMIAACLCFAMVPSMASAKVKAKVCTVAPEGTPWEQLTKKVKKIIRKESSSELKIKVYFGGAKGGENECIAKVHANELQMYGGTLSAMNKYAPALEVFDLPFLFKNSAQADFVLDKYATPIVSKLLEKGGLVLYMWAENGWHNIGANKFIKKPSDLAGITIRAQPSKVHPLTWSTLGAVPVELSTEQVTDGFRDKKVVAFGQTPLYTFAANWQPHITHYTLTQHLYQPGVLVWSKKFHDAQTKEIQKFMHLDPQALAEEGREGVRKLEPQLIENFRSYGIKVYQLTPAEKKAFATKAKDVFKIYRSKASPEAKQLLDVIEKGRKAFK
ncbi:MAG: TRAP transporter substrate-binding protein DctP [Deltaproteobacteria bacterium]|jgi:TRAP-type transport system periplasmic protein|nr:TRAP transporter substrate-binding protein DctP [Deltaproteobacteria bacterium]MBT6491366.1 TRAP transporter substrate-binding protein DctP [Deltaproteobacteria bacterium]